MQTLPIPLRVKIENRKMPEIDSGENCAGLCYRNYHVLQQNKFKAAILKQPPLNIIVASRIHLEPGLSIDSIFLFQVLKSVKLKALSTIEDCVKDLLKLTKWEKLTSDIGGGFGRLCNHHQGQFPQCFPNRDHPRTHK